MSADIVEKQETVNSPTDTQETFWTQRKIGILLGVISGMLWGLDTVLLNEAYWYTPLNGNYEGIVTGAVATMIHDMFSAILLILIILIFRLWQETKEACTTFGFVWMVFASVFGAPIGMLGYLMAIQHLGGAYTAAISSLYPALGAFLAFLFLKEKLFLHGWVGLILAVLGTIGTSITAIVEGGQEVDQPGYGILFALLCVLGWGSECVIADYSFRFYTMDSTIALAIRQLTSVFVYGVIIVNAIGDEAYEVTREVFKNESLEWIIGASICGTFSYLAYYAAISKLGSTQAIALNITYAIWTIIFGTALKVYPSYAGVIVACVLVIAIGSFMCSGLGKEPMPIILLKSWFNMATPEELQEMEKAKSTSDITSVADTPKNTDEDVAKHPQLSSSGSSGVPHTDDVQLAVL